MKNSMFEWDWHKSHRKGKIEDMGRMLTVKLNQHGRHRYEFIGCDYNYLHRYWKFAFLDLEGATTWFSQTCEYWFTEDKLNEFLTENH